MMLAAVAQVRTGLIPLKCTGTTSRGFPCEKTLMMVDPEHLAMVKQRISIKCHHCGTLQ